MRKTSALGSELRGDNVTRLINLGLAQGAKFICLGDYANSRGAADMGLSPCCRLRPRFQRDHFRENWVDEISPRRLNLLQMMDAAKDGKLKALSVVGSDPVARSTCQIPSRCEGLRRGARHVSHREAARHRQCVIAGRCLRKKVGPSPTPAVTCRCSRKAGEFAGVRNDFECIVRIADRMGYHVHKLRAVWRRSSASDMGQIERIVRRRLIWRFRQTTTDGEARELSSWMHVIVG